MLDIVLSLFSLDFELSCLNCLGNKNIGIVKINIATPRIKNPSHWESNYRYESVFL